MPRTTCSWAAVTRSWSSFTTRLPPPGPPPGPPWPPSARAPCRLATPASSRAWQASSWTPTATCSCPTRPPARSSSTPTALAPAPMPPRGASWPGRAGQAMARTSCTSPRRWRLTRAATSSPTTPVTTGCWSSPRSRAMSAMAPAAPWSSAMRPVPTPRMAGSLSTPRATCSWATTSPAPSCTRLPL